MEGQRDKLLFPIEIVLQYYYLKENIVVKLNIFFRWWEHEDVDGSLPYLEYRLDGGPARVSPHVDDDTEAQLPHILTARKTYLVFTNGSRYRTAPHRTALYCTVLRCTALNYAARHFAQLRCTVLHCSTLRCTVLYSNELHCTALHYPKCTIPDVDF